MTIEELRAFLGWCVIGNVVLLLLWYGAFVFAHDFIYRYHQEAFKLSRETFDALHYGGMAAFKMAVWLFVLVPYLVLRFAF
jgi:hypothetical protein